MKKLSSAATADDADAAANDQAGVQSVETGMLLLSALAKLTYDGPAPNLTALAAKAGLPPAKAHRYLVSFLRTGMVERDAATGRYGLGPLALEISVSALRGFDVVRSASALIPEISARLQHSMALAVWGARGATVVWVHPYPRPITISSRVGEVLPMLTSATGRVFGAFLPSGQTEAVLDEELSHTRGPVGERRNYERLRDEVRAAGVGWAEGDLNPAIHALSAPIFDYRGEVVAALTSLGSTHEFDPERNGRLAQMLKEAAWEISLTLGCQRHP
ncbi:MAG: hypothetical protein JWO33_2551 [Caulobacteraceae bacterium]|nr:hypothetical protein [Caulobacteraceae bacterium]